MPSITPGTSEDLGQILEGGTEHYDIILLKHGLHEKTNMGRDSLKLKKKKLPSSKYYPKTLSSILIVILSSW